MLFCVSYFLIECAQLASKNLFHLCASPANFRWNLGVNLDFFLSCKMTKKQGSCK